MRHVTGKAAKVLVLSALTAAALALSAAAAEESVGVGAVTGSSVRLRAEASTSSEILVTMEKGSVVALLSETPEDDWYHVAFAGSEGYVHADYVIKDKDNVFSTYGRANCGGVRIRTEASTESDVAATITEGTAFTVTGFQDGWYSVKCKYGTTGYIRSDLVDLIPSVQAKAYYGVSVQDLRDHYQSMLQTNRCADLMEMVLSIYAKKARAEQTHKKFGAVDERFMRQAETLFAGEIAASLGITPEEVPDYIARRVHAAQADGAGISLSEMAAAQDVQQQEQQNQILVPQNIVDRCHDVCQNCFHFCFTSFISFWQIKNAASKMLRRENGRELVRFVLSHSVLLPERFSSFRCLAPSVPVFRDSPEPHPFLVVT